MTSDLGGLIGDLFGQDTYPGSKRKRREPAFRPDPVDPESWRKDPVMKTVGGRQVEMFTIGAFASALQVSVPTLKEWMRDGRIPEAPYRLPSNMVINGSDSAPGRRLWRAEHIESAVEVFRNHGLMDRAKRITWSKHPTVAVDILHAWQNISRTQQNPEE